MDSKTVVALVLVFAPLSLVSIGGGQSVITEMHHQAVMVQGWVTEREFRDLFVISRAAPGPGALLVTLIGWRAAGWLGVLVVSLAFFLPSSILVYGVALFWNRWRGSPWHAAIEEGFAPIAAGLILASGVTILRSGSNDLLAWGTACFVAAWRLWRPRTHPLVLMGLGVATFVLVRTLT